MALHSFGNIADKMASGNTNTRPAPASAGQFRYNTEIECLEVFDGDYWHCTGVRPGTIHAWGGAADSIPNGYLLCDGATYASTDHPSLFNAIVYTHGRNGDNFLVPNLQDRFIMGAGSSYNVANTGGEESVSLSVAQMPSHNHTQSSSGNSSKGLVRHDGTTPGFPNVGPGTPNTYKIIFDGSGFAGGPINPTGGGASHNNIPPYYALVYIIKT